MPYLCLLLTLHVLKLSFIFIRVFYLIIFWRQLYTHHGAQTPDPAVKVVCSTAWAGVLPTTWNFLKVIPLPIKLKLGLLAFCSEKSSGFLYNLGVLLRNNSKRRLRKIFCAVRTAGEFPSPASCVSRLFKPEIRCKALWDFWWQKRRCLEPQRRPEQRGRTPAVTECWGPDEDLARAPRSPSGGVASPVREAASQSRGSLGSSGVL